MSRMHAAAIENSPRLRRVLTFLRMGPGTTYEIIKSCDVCAVNNVISELRANGYVIDCKPVKGNKGMYRYELIGEV